MAFDRASGSKKQGTQVSESTPVSLYRPLVNPASLKAEEQSASADLEVEEGTQRGERFNYNFARVPVHAPGHPGGMPIQGRFEGEPKGRSAPPPFSPAMFTSEMIESRAIQAKGYIAGNSPQLPVEARLNKTGLPDALKTGIENLSGYSLDNVRVHYNSPKPAQLQAHAYTQGTEIQIAPGQEKHLPHEAWHVVQQAQSRVKPTLQTKGVAINDDAGLEQEAEVMGAKAMQIQSLAPRATGLLHQGESTSNPSYPFVRQAYQMQTSQEKQFGFHVNRASVHRLKNGRIDNTDDNKSKTIQLGRILKDENWKSPNKKHSKKYYRVINKAKEKYGYKNTAKRNLFVLRLTSKDKKKRLNILLRSAGMGGKHPRGIGGRSAAHTEPQAAAILQNKNVTAHIEKKLGKGWEVYSVFSSNQPCSSKGGGSETGCGGMDSKLFKNPSYYHTAADTDYVGGKGLSQGQTLKALEENDDYSDGSEDEHLGENKVRGFDLNKDDLDFSDLDE